MPASTTEKKRPIDMTAQEQGAETIRLLDLILDQLQRINESTKHRQPIS